MGRTKKQGKLGFLAPLLLFAAGAGIFLYPAVSNFIAEQEQRAAIRTYEAVMDEEDAQSLEKEWQMAREYNENLAGDPVHDPFVYGSGYVLPDNYESVLNVNGDGVMGYIDIPKIGVYLPIYHGTDEETLAKGAGHLEATALPIGSAGGHSVISAHRGLPSAELFTRLNEMETGDIFYIHVLDETLAYEVDQINVIDPQELTSLKAHENQDLVTLLTCTPYGVNTQRLLVRGSRIPYEEAVNKTPETDIESTWLREYIAAIVVGVGLLIIVLVFFMIRKRRKRKKGPHSEKE